MNISRLMQMGAAGLPKAPNFGDFFEGGFYAGNIVEGGVEYYIVVAPKSVGEITPIQFKTSQTASPAATQTLNNGPAATAAMVSSGSHPAANFCAGLTINGFSDWYLPSRDELELCYRNLKPSSADNITSTRLFSSITYPEGTDVSGDITGVNRNSNPTGDGYTLGIPAQTLATAFQAGGSETFESSKGYYSSSEFSSTKAWEQFFSNGTQNDGNKDTTSRCARAVRRIAV